MDLLRFNKRGTRRAKITLSRWRQLALRSKARSRARVRPPSFRGPARATHARRPPRTSSPTCSCVAPRTLCPRRSSSRRSQLFPAASQPLSTVSLSHRNNLKQRCASNKKHIDSTSYGKHLCVHMLFCSKSTSSASLARTRRAQC